MFEFLVELILELFGEALLQVVFEALAEALARLFGRTRTPGDGGGVLAVAGYAMLGLVSGALSLLLVPHSLMHSHAGRVAALLLAPVIAGLAMVLLGRWRRRAGKASSELTRFGCGYAFALGMAVVRFLFAG